MSAYRALDAPSRGAKQPTSSASVGSTASPGPRGARRTPGGQTGDGHDGGMPGGCGVPEQVSLEVTLGGSGGQVGRWGHEAGRNPQRPPGAGKPGPGAEGGARARPGPRGAASLPAPGACHLPAASPWSPAAARRRTRDLKGTEESRHRPADCLPQEGPPLRAPALGGPWSPVSLSTCRTGVRDALTSLSWADSFSLRRASGPKGGP